MGNSQNKAHNHQRQSSYTHSDGQAYSSQFSLSNFVGNLSGRSFLSITSHQSVYSASRPWSRVSRRRWRESTCNNRLEASKTAWPVAHIESLFLPEFPISSDLAQKEFEVITTIAKGAFGEVFKVKKICTNQDYALKVLSKAKVVSESAVQQVKDEARIQELCGHHPFIVGAVAKWQTKKRLYIVSEYIPGGELWALLGNYGNIPEEIAKIFVAEIALALDFLHNAGVVYRDLKPENLLLDSEGHLQLIDFGLSKWLSAGCRTTTFCGTLHYMAPELASAEGYGHAVDWWSLGVLACYVMTREFPVPGVDAPNLKTTNSESQESRKGSRREQAGKLPPSAVQLSSGAQKLLQQLLEVDPRRRLRSLRLMQHSAFYMGFDWEQVRAMKISPKMLLAVHFPDGPPMVQEKEAENLRLASQAVFSHFDQITIV